MCIENTGILNHNGTWTIAGIVVGFCLAELSFIIKKYKEQKECKNALIEEIRFNHEQTKNKIFIIDQSIAALKQKKFLSPQCTSYSTIEFDNLYHKALPRLKSLEKDNLRHLNCFYKKIDCILDTFDQEFKNDIDNCEKRQIAMESIYESATIRLEDICNSLKSSIDLTNALLKGSPKPIFSENA